MKLISTTLLAGSLALLAACGGAEEENVAANAAGEDLYNVVEGDVLLDNSLGNDLGNVSLGNETDSANLSSDTNLSESNSAANDQ